MTDREAIEYFEAIFETEVLGKTDIEAMNIAISALREREERAMNWISVDERLPEDGELVLVCDIRDGFFAVLEHDSSEYAWHGGDYWLDEDEVTHWIPLLESSKGEE